MVDATPKWLRRQSRLTSVMPLVGSTVYIVYDEGFAARSRVAPLGVFVTMVRGFAMKRVAWLLAVVVAGGAASTWTRGEDKAALPPLVLPQDRNSADRIQPALTEPNREYQISFPTMGVIKEVRVKEGEPVKKDQVLMVQDATEEVAELEDAQH